MPAWNTKTQDFLNRFGDHILYRVKGGPQRKFPFGIKTLQGGTMNFNRKKKNGCKLASSGQIKRSVNERQKDVIGVTYAKAFPPIKL